MAYLFGISWFGFRLWSRVVVVDRLLPGLHGVVITGFWKRKAKVKFVSTVIIIFTIQKIYFGTFRINYISN